jgi:hypothetical protein
LPCYEKGVDMMRPLLCYNVACAHEAYLATLRTGRAICMARPDGADKRAVGIAFEAKSLQRC